MPSYRTCDVVICDGRLPRWAVTFAGDNKRNMKIACDKRITVILNVWLQLFTSANPLGQLGD